MFPGFEVMAVSLDFIQQFIKDFSLQRSERFVGSGNRWRLAATAKASREP
jgi:hypothetical protein